MLINLEDPESCNCNDLKNSKIIISCVQWFWKEFSGLQTYPNLHLPLRVGPPPGCLPRGGANLCRFVPVRSLQTRASGREFVHVCFGLFGPLMQVGAKSDGFGALWKSQVIFGERLVSLCTLPPYTLRIFWGFFLEITSRGAKNNLKK